MVGLFLLFIPLVAVILIAPERTKSEKTSWFIKI
jgi:hypothetical protein